MMDVRIRHKDAKRLARETGIVLAEGENLLSTGAKLVARPVGGRNHYFIYGYHYAGQDVKEILAKFSIVQIW